MQFLTKKNKICMLMEDHNNNKIAQDGVHYVQGVCVICGRNNLVYSPRPVDPQAYAQRICTKCRRRPLEVKTQCVDCHSASVEHYHSDTVQMARKKISIFEPISCAICIGTIHLFNEDVKERRVQSPNENVIMLCNMYGVNRTTKKLVPHARYFLDY